MNNQVTQPLRGARDFYPEDMRKRRSLLDRVRRSLESFGYEEYDAPILEPLSLYAAKSSEEIITRQSYVFEDRGGERLVVRPEMTPSFARMVAARQRQLPPILRWYSIPECWRYERPQRGRLRCFMQVNVDMVGSDSVQADVEVIDIALSMIRSLGIDMKSIELRLNDRSLLNGWLTEVGADKGQWGNILSLLDERNKLDQKDFRLKLFNLVPSEVATRLMSFFTLSARDVLADKRAERLREVKEKLDQLDWSSNVKVDTSIIRGFSYYTGVVFEVYDTSCGITRALFGGGRYDGLVEALGGSPVSGIGFGVSDVSLDQLLASQNITLPFLSENKICVIPFSQGEEAATDDCLVSLRRLGYTALRALPPYNIKKQLAIAQKNQVSFVRGEKG
jgi:histidyl-tRNA synthetase